MAGCGCEHHGRSRGGATVNLQALVSTCHSCLERITDCCSSPSPRSYLQPASATLIPSDLAAHDARRPHGASTHLVAARSMPPLICGPTRPHARCFHTPTVTISLQTSGQTLSPLVWHLYMSPVRPHRHLYDTWTYPLSDLLAASPRLKWFFDGPAVSHTSPPQQHKGSISREQVFADRNRRFIGGQR